MNTPPIHVLTGIHDTISGSKRNTIRMMDQYPTPFRIDPKPSYDLITKTWFPGFSGHVLFTYLDDDEKEYAEQIILDFTGFILYYQDCTPENWSPAVIERCLLKDFPRSLARTEEYEYAIFNVLFNFFAYLREENLLPAADDLFSHVISIKDEFDKRMGDTDLYSPRKALIISSLNEGIQEDDYDAMIEYFNQVGSRELADIDADTVEIVNKIMGTWVLPFSDSRYMSDVEGANGDDLIFVTSLLITGTLSNRPHMPPSDWDTEIIFEFIKDQLAPHPIPKKIREKCIPILHGFFTFLADQNLQPHAREIANDILPLQEMMITKESDEDVSDMEFFLVQSLLKAGVDISDEEAICDFLDENTEKLLQKFIESSDAEELKKLMGNTSASRKQIPKTQKKPDDISSIPKANREWFIAITEMTDTFCNERLDDEYAGICRHVAGKLARKRDNKITRGKREIWAAGIIYAVGQMNFLFDSSFEPYQSADDICQYFGTRKSTTSQKAKLIRDHIGMNDYWDPEYSTSHMQNNNPMSGLRMTRDGFII